MLHRQALKPEEFIENLVSLSEGLIAIRNELSNKLYQVLIYKYENGYYILQNPDLFHMLMENGNVKFIAGEALLDNIEHTLEDNHYVPVDETWICLDIRTFLHMNDQKNLEIDYFEFREDML